MAGGKKQNTSFQGEKWVLVFPIFCFSKKIWHDSVFNVEIGANNIHTENAVKENYWGRWGRTYFFFSSSSNKFDHIMCGNFPSGTLKNTFVNLPMSVQRWEQFSKNNDCWWWPVSSFLLKKYVAFLPFRPIAHFFTQSILNTHTLRVSLLSTQSTHTFHLAHIEHMIWSWKKWKKTNKSKVTRF